MSTMEHLEHFLIMPAIPTTISTQLDFLIFSEKVTEMSATDWRSTEEYRQYASGPREVRFLFENCGDKESFNLEI